MISELTNVVLSQGMISRDFLTTLLSGVRKSIQQIPVTKHPLGFVHYDLSRMVDLPSGGFARLHIWDREIATPDPAGNIHDHTWHLTSAILAGSLRDRTFLPCENPSGALSAAQVRYGQTNSFEAAGCYDLVPLTDQIFKRGDIYKIPSRIVHESEPLEKPTVTFVVGIPDENAALLGPLILSRITTTVPTGTAQRETVGQAEAIRLLDAIEFL